MEIKWTTIQDIVQETPDIRTYFLDCPADFTWKSGAHTHFALEGFNDGEKPDKGMVRHMSISTLPDENKIGITTRIRQQKSRFKDLLDKTEIGDSVALFKTGARLPLYREDKPLYFLSSGVGLATFRPLVLEYLKDNQGISHLHSLHVDSSQDTLFSTVFTSDSAQKFTHKHVYNRDDYYQAVNDFTESLDGYYYVVGSDEFLMDNLALLVEKGLSPDQIILDKHEHQRVNFFK